MQTPIPCIVMRGGTSRGLYFHARDLPQDPALRDAVLLAAMGGPDTLQIDGIGGGHPLSNKVAIINTSLHENADVDYLFAQVNARQQSVSTAQNCGNILAGVGPFAIDQGLVGTQTGETRVRVHMSNSDSLCELTVTTPGGVVAYTGQVSLDGVPGTAAPVMCDFLEVAGSTCGTLFPTGQRQDRIEGMEVTCIDNGMPVILVRAESLGLQGDESPQQLNEHTAVRQRIEALRRAAGPRMQLGDVRDATVPKITLISAPREGGLIATRTLIPHLCHQSIGVLGAVTVATACVAPGTVAEGLARVPEGARKLLSVEHPCGALQVRLVLGDGEFSVLRAGVLRTTRMIFRGELLIPSAVWNGHHKIQTTENHA